MNKPYDTHHFLSGEHLKQSIASAARRLPAVLARPLSLEHLLQCVARFARGLAKREIDLPLNDAQHSELLGYCDADALRLKVARELGEHPFQLRRIDDKQPRFEAWRPLGCVLHVMPSNAPLLPFLATLESLLAGNVNWVRPSGGDPLSILALEALAACDESGLLSQYIVPWPVAQADVVRLLPHVQGVSAWGGDAALDSLRRQLPSGCRWIPWGHKISFVYATPAILKAGTTQLDAIADAVCRFNQQACSSPQLLLVDSDDPVMMRRLGQALAFAFKRRAAASPALIPDAHQAADVGAAVALAQLEQAFERQQGEIWEGDGWRVIWKHEIALDASPLFRTLLLRPMPRARLCSALFGWRPHLQTCALACLPAEMPQLSQDLLTAGVGRVTLPQEMHDGYTGEPHDDVRALTRLMRRVSVSLPAEAVTGRATLDPYDPAHHPAPSGPVMDRAALVADGYRDSARLFFRSGGSTGTPVLSAFSYRDYHRQMRAAADGMLAAGLDPQRDRLLNLLYAGNLYGGMLSSFVALDKMDVVHFPMGYPREDCFDELAELISAHRINTILGMPTTVHQLFRRQEERLRAYGGITKIFFGGEPMARQQREFIAGFGVGLIRSAIYGANDAGPIGHACAHGEDGDFHLLADVQQLEVVAQDRDAPALPGEPGRLLVTSLAREAQRVVRYDIGDLGYLLPGPCPCGMPTPRFRLLGRHGRLVRVGTMPIDSHHLTTHLGLPVQFVISTTDDGVDLLTAHVDGDIATAQARLTTFMPIALIIDKGLARLAVEYAAQDTFECSSHSGKAALFIDRRVSA